jgi:hypothetical protein
MMILDYFHAGIKASLVFFNAGGARGGTINSVAVVVCLKSFQSSIVKLFICLSFSHSPFFVMSVVGLDFGTKNAVIAAAGRGGVDVILNGNSNRLNVS